MRQTRHQGVTERGLRDAMEFSKARKALYIFLQKKNTLQGHTRLPMRPEYGALTELGQRDVPLLEALQMHRERFNFFEPADFFTIPDQRWEKSKVGKQ